MIADLRNKIFEFCLIFCACLVCLSFSLTLTLISGMLRVRALLSYLFMSDGMGIKKYG